MAILADFAAPTTRFVTDFFAFLAMLLSLAFGFLLCGVHRWLLRGLLCRFLRSFLWALLRGLVWALLGCGFLALCTGFLNGLGNLLCLFRHPLSDRCSGCFRCRLDGALREHTGGAR
jgi:hypothetical protein